VRFGVGFEVLANRFNHSSPATTIRYLGITKKEVEDTMNEKSVADMSRAKSLKSLFRMVTPHLTLKDIPLIVVNHTYMEIGMFPKAVVGGGTGIYYSADTIWILVQLGHDRMTALTLTVRVSASLRHS
jgi:hypothetical protein